MSFTYNAAGQIATKVTSNTAFVYVPTVASTTNYAINSLNQISTANGISLGYDCRGNLVSDTTTGGCATLVGNYTYNANNLMTSAVQSSVTSTLTYDAENRLGSITKNGATTKFLYDGKRYDR